MRSYLLICVIVVSLVVPLLQAGAQALDVNSRFSVGKALAEGRETIDVMIATREGKYRDFIAFLRTENIPVRFESADLEYVRVSVPIEKIEKIASNKLIEAVSTDNIGYPPVFFSSSDKKLSESHLPARRLDQLMDDSAVKGDLLDFEAMGLMTLRKSYPHADGRGVTIAFIEEFVDPDTPEMGQARTLDGKIVPKIRAMYEANSYMANAFPTASSKPGRNGVRLTTAVAGADGKLPIGNRDVRAPSPGRYWVGVVDENNYGRVTTDFNKDGNTAHKDRTFAVARKENEKCFRVDANQNNDLTDDTCLADFNDSRQTGRFPSASRDKLGMRFWILTTPEPDWIVLATPATHAHVVASAAAGAPVFDPRLSGAAPAAQIISIGVSEFGSASFLEAFIRAAHDPRVDFILATALVPTIRQGGLDVHSIIRDRIVSRKNKIIIGSAGNYGNMSSAVVTSVEGHNVLAVGQFNSKKVKSTIFNITGPDSSNIGSSGGPLIDGRLKPDILAPSFVITADSDSFDGSGSYNGLACANLTLPPRAICAGGTSTAAPVAAGGVASLLSVLKKEKMDVHALEVLDAIRFSARHVSTIPVYLQGHGVLNIPASLERLLMKGPQRPMFVIEAPVPRRMFEAAGKAVRGKGLFEREGWHPGMKGSRTIKITRRSGPDGDLIFITRIIGDTGKTYTAPPRLILPLNKTIEVPIGIFPRTHGLHSALLELRAEKNGDIVERINLTTIASIRFQDLVDGQLYIKEKGSAWRAPIFYVDVPKDTSALGVDVDVMDAYMMTLHFQGPMAGVSAMVERVDGPESEVQASFPPAEGIRRAVLWPSPGVWQLAIPYKSPVPGDVDSSGRIIVVTDREVEKIVAKASKKNGLIELTSNQKALSARRTWGFYKSGSLRSVGHIIPSLIPLEAPAEASWVEVRAKVREGRLAKTAHNAVAIALFDCSGSGCKAVDSAIGQDRAGLMKMVAPKSRLYAAILSLNERQKPLVVDYEIYFPLTDAPAHQKIGAPGRLGAVSASTAHRSSPYLVCYIYAVHMDGLSKSIGREKYSEKNGVLPGRLKAVYDINMTLNKDLMDCKKTAVEQ